MLSSICETSKRKKYDFEYNSKSCESEKQQDKNTNYKRQINNIKCLHKQDVEKKLKIRQNSEKKTNR